MHRISLALAIYSKSFSAWFDKVPLIEYVGEIYKRISTPFLWHRFNVSSRSLRYSVETTPSFLMLQTFCGYLYPGEVNSYNTINTCIKLLIFNAYIFI